MKPGDIVWMGTTDCTGDGWKAEKTRKHGHLWMVLAERFDEEGRRVQLKDADRAIHLRSLADGTAVTTYKDGLHTYPLETQEAQEAEEEQPHGETT